jgi:hypothetical protein
MYVLFAASEYHMVCWPNKCLGIYNNADTKNQHIIGKNSKVLFKSRQCLIPETNMMDIANAVELEPAAMRGVPASYF